MKQMEQEEKRQERQREKEHIAREGQEEAALESLQKSYRTRKPVKRFIEESDSESSMDFKLESDEITVSEDSESDQHTDCEMDSVTSQEIMEYHEGSANWCAKCERKFNSKAAEKAIGSEGVYCSC